MAMTPARALLFPALFLLACSSSTQVIEPDLAGGKADIADQVNLGSPLSFATPANEVFNEDLQFYGHTISVRPGADVRFDITHGGTAAALDTSMFLYGPRSASGAYGTSAIDFDNDDGWGKHSRIDTLLANGGEYLVVVGTANGRGRGRYRLVATCRNGDCGPVDQVCHPWVRGNILACFRAMYADAEFDPSTPTPTAEEVLDHCTDGEALGPIFDNTCAAPTPPDYCGLGFDTFAQTMGPSCAEELAPYAVDCAFGRTFSELHSSPNLAVGPRRVLTTATSLSQAESSQVIAAVLSASFADVTTIAEAFDAADQGEVNQIEVYDRTSGAAYVVYEFGAGDTSVGAYFELGSDQPVAVNGDGDLEWCTAGKGVMNNDCSSNLDCTAGSCMGKASETGMGRCVDTNTGPGGDDCSVTNRCDLQQGLMCSGLSRSDVGLCFPAWMRGNFSDAETNVEIPDGDQGGLERSLIVSGLATVDMDVEIDLIVRHPDPGQLRITLENRMAMWSRSLMAPAAMPTSCTSAAPCRALAATRRSTERGRCAPSISRVARSVRSMSSRYRLAVVSTESRQRVRPTPPGTRPARGSR